MLASYEELLSPIADLREVICNNLTITYAPSSIEDLFPDNISVIDYSPYYQRNYIWDINKASFFIESILGNKEIPPLIFFRHKDKVEIIDGRQRYETILRFLDGRLKLSRKGLTSLKYLAGKSIHTIGEEYVRILKKVQIRIYEYKFHSTDTISAKMEERLKQEIFNRYNSGITPLTQLEIFKAQYINDIVNNNFKKKLEESSSLFNLVIDTFHIKPANLSSVLKKIRHLLVMHHMPISSYVYRKNEINRIYDHFSALTIESQGWENIFQVFKSKIDYLQEIKQALNDQPISYSGQTFEALFWALSICNKENIPPDKINSPKFKKDLVSYIRKTQRISPAIANHKFALTKDRFANMTLFFSQVTDIDFEPYLNISAEFSTLNNRLLNHVKQTNDDQILKELSFIRKDARTISVSSLIKEIESSNCRIRPHYQRGDVISRVKSSSIIESLILGIQLPPIFMYTRKNGSSEIIDGQQRILSFLAYMGAGYYDENDVFVFSKRNNFKLSLANGIARELHDKRFKSLPEHLQHKIRQSIIQIVDIHEETNPNFDPVDLFMRLNFKPYPIRKDTFESWNSVTNRDIIVRIKSLREKHQDWFYCGKKNDRMQEEELVTLLIYLHYVIRNNQCTLEEIEKIFAICIVDGRLHLRFSCRGNITKTFKDVTVHEDFLMACDQFEQDFLYKLKMLISSSASDDINGVLNEMLFSKTEGKSRTHMRFYILWIVLSNISVDSIHKFHATVQADITQLFNKILKVKRTEQFVTLIKNIWNKYELS